jgi:hypothetical protein
VRVSGSVLSHNFSPAGQVSWGFGEKGSSVSGAIAQYALNDLDILMHLVLYLVQGQLQLFKLIEYTRQFRVGVWLGTVWGVHIKRKAGSKIAGWIALLDVLIERAGQLYGPDAKLLIQRQRTALILAQRGSAVALQCIQTHHLAMGLLVCPIVPQYGCGIVQAALILSSCFTIGSKLVQQHQIDLLQPLALIEAPVKIDPIEEIAAI